MRPRQQYLLITLIFALLASTLIVGVLAQEDGKGGEDVGEFHCNLGEAGFFLAALTLGSGLLVSGRFGRIKGFNSRSIHKYIALLTAFYLTGEFLYGMSVMNKFFLNSIHRTLGFITVLLAWLTIFASPCISGKVIKWKTASRVHAIFAIALFVVLVIHITYGLSLFG